VLSIFSFGIQENATICFSVISFGHIELTTRNSYHPSF